MSDIVTFLVRYGEVVLLLYVFGDQMGLPLPAVPILLAAGGLAGAGRLSFPVAVGLAMIGSLVADLIWYLAGRLRGSRVLGLLCRVSLEPDTCVRSTENFFLRYGVRSLLVAKFIPGLSTVAPPLAGVIGVRVPRFLIYSAAAAFLWAGVWLTLGYVAGNALERVIVGAGQFGRAVAAALAVVIVGYVVFKWIQRRRFLRRLRIARVSAPVLISHRGCIGCSQRGTMEMVDGRDEKRLTGTKKGCDHGRHHHAPRDRRERQTLQSPRYAQPSWCAE